MENQPTYGQVIPLLRRNTRGALASQPPVGRPALTDIHPDKLADPAGTGFVVSSLRDADGPILWVQDYASRRENGSLYMPGMSGAGISAPILQVTVSHARDVLWAMEEGASCKSLAAVVGEIHGAPPALSFTATKRLILRAQTSGVAVYLIRSGDPGTLSAARERWRIGSLPSERHPQDSRAPGVPYWDVDLFRTRGRAPGRWVARYDPAAPQPADRLRLVPRTDDRAMDTGDQSVSDRSRA